MATVSKADKVREASSETKEARNTKNHQKTASGHTQRRINDRKRKRGRRYDDFEGKAVAAINEQSNKSWEEASSVL